MTAAGDAVLAYAYSQIGNVENPPNSNVCSPYTDAWGAGAWCAMFVSYCNDAAGYPLPPINGPAGFSYCPDGQISAFSTGHSVGSDGVQPGDSLIFSWEPFYYGNDSIAYCSSGIYAGAPAGDHTGFFVEWLGDSYMRTVEGNTSQSSWDNGGAVMERTDRYAGQICCYARHAALGSGGSQGAGFLMALTDQQQQDVYNNAARTHQIVERINTDYYVGSTGDPNLLRSMQAQIDRQGQIIERMNRDLYGGEHTGDPNLWQHAIAVLARLQLLLERQNTDLYTDEHTEEPNLYKRLDS